MRLPVDAFVPRIVEEVRRARAIVVVAEPGAGKTTRVPPALAEAFGRTALLQPRRVAARSIARRIAEERGWTLGREVGWHVRHERRHRSDTRLVVMTEGILTARLASDPLLHDFDVVVLDEFHERSLHADLALALAREALRARADLRLAVMSATLDAAAVARYLGDCPVVAVPGRAHPIAIEHDARAAPHDAVVRALGRAEGHVLCFLPGAGEIARTHDALRGRTGDALVLPLHGSLTPEQQDAALAPAPGARRKVILATNVAETSLTIDGVTEVVDSGLHKVLRHDPARGLDRLHLERIPQDSADQRAGRAGRTAPGRALRLWDARDALRPHREPDVARVDLAGPLLDVLAWGGDPLDFPWLDPPAAGRVEAALELLARLGAVAQRRLTPLGAALRELRVAPRLGVVLAETRGSARAAAACALLAEGRPWRDPPVATDSDVLSAADAIASAPLSVRRAAEELERSARRVFPDGPPRDDAAAIRAGGSPRDDDAAIRRALFHGFSDRLAKRREPGSAKLLLASGTGAQLGRESGVRDAELLVALETTSATASGETVVRSASAVDRDWIETASREVVNAYDAPSRSVRASRVERFGAIRLSETPVAPDPAEAHPILVRELLASGFGDASGQVSRRLRFAGLGADLAAMAGAACAGRTSLPDAALEMLLPNGTRRELERLAPARLEVPSGRALPLEYREDGSVVLEVKLQELFGLGETPRIGPGRTPVTLSLLSPAGRPVQLTQDLRGFWDRTYPEVRKELRARYPRHPWPEDPWTAPPTARAKRRT